MFLYRCRTQEQVWFLEFKLLVSQGDKLVAELLHSMLEVLVFIYS